LDELKKFTGPHYIKLRFRRVYEDLRIGRHHVPRFEAATTKSGLAPIQFSAMTASAGVPLAASFTPSSITLAATPLSARKVLREIDTVLPLQRGSVLSPSGGADVSLQSKQQSRKW
jgi:hypothetical protein